MSFLSAHGRSFIGLLLIIGLLIRCSPPSTSSQQPSTTPSAEQDNIYLTDVTEEAGLDEFVHETGAFGEKWFPETAGAGGGFIDYNGDGWLDILLVGGGGWEESPAEDVRGLWLYRNNGDQTFTLVNEEVGLNDISAYGFGIAVADYDNDDDQDFIFTTLHENMLFQNNNGVFQEVGNRAGIGNFDEWSTSAMFFDADNDGHLDLYVANYVDWSPEKDIWCTLDGKTKEYCTPDLYEGIPSRYYHNNGDGTFTEQTKEAGFIPTPGNSFGVAALDFNRDGWTDVAVANDMQRNLLYKNNGDGTFTEQGTISGIAYGEDGKVRAGMGIDAGYVSGPRDPSIVVGNFAEEMIGVFRHTGDGLFVDRAAVSKVGNATLRTLTFGLFLFDIDLDGDQDLFAANGHIKPGLEHVQNDIRYRQRSQLFINDGRGVFKEVDPSQGVLDKRLVARGAAYGDFDRDGDQDILVMENGGSAHLWQNNHTANHFLRVHLNGRKSNSDGIGARIEAVTAGNRRTRLVSTGSSYLSQSEKTVTLGLGTSTKVDSLIVHWPSGQTDRFLDVEANQSIRITEGVSQIKPVASTHSNISESTSPAILSHRNE